MCVHLNPASSQRLDEHVLQLKLSSRATADGGAKPAARAAPGKESGAATSKTASNKLLVRDVIIRITTVMVNNNIRAAHLIMVIISLVCFFVLLLLLRYDVWGRNLQDGEQQTAGARRFY